MIIKAKNKWDLNANAGESCCFTHEWFRRWCKNKYLDLTDTESNRTLNYFEVAFSKQCILFDVPKNLQCLFLVNVLHNGLYLFHFLSIYQQVRRD